MNRALTSLAVLFMAVAANAVTIVYPTGNPASDVDNVRAAVRGGGTILLKATDAAGQPREFDFGDFPVDAINWNDFGSGYVALGTHGEIVPLTAPSGRTVYLSFGNDVHLLGETVGGSMTTIRGGTIPIRNFEPVDLPGVGTKSVYGMGSMRVEGIRFTESALQSIYTVQFSSTPSVLDLVRTRGAHLRTEILGNEFIDVQPAFGGYWYALAAVTDRSAAQVTLSNNVIRFSSGRWSAAERQFESDNHLPRRPELFEGLSIADLRNPAEITGNDLAGIDVGVLVYFNGSEVVHVADNRVELGPDGRVGISLQANHTYLVERNTVFANGLFADGIDVWATDPDAGINNSTIRNNRVVTSGAVSGGISLLDGGRNNLIAQNRIEGIGAWALGMSWYFSPGVLSGNVFTGNNVSHFDGVDSNFASGTTVYFDVNSRDNVLVGNSGTVTDLGVNNSITGVPRSNHGTGQARREALAARRDLFKEVLQPRD